MKLYEDPNDFLQAKWKHAFYIFFDLNYNDFIDWNDFVTLMNLIELARGKHSDEYLTAKFCLTEVWDSMTEALDMQHDDKICLTDWISMWTKSMTLSKAPAWQKAYVEYIFKLLDASGDKLVDQAEYVQVLGYFGVPKTTALWCFDKFAIDDTGHPVHSIDYRRFLQLWKEFFTSTDVNARGNFLLGEIT
ncbi:unnamed protein product [Auanema sp. JU1783]|nr:unnamed protein product [Auanema sp. JU1783]